MPLQTLLPTDARILIVDDVKSHRISLRLALNELGYNSVVEAGDGEEALRIALAEPTLQLIISDWEMPNMEGIELARRLSQDERCESIPFVMATARCDLAYLAEATFTGVWGYVVKPYSVESLLSELEGALLERAEMRLE